MKKLTYLVLLGMTLILLATVGSLPTLYDGNSAPSVYVSPRYIEKSYEETGSHNFVTAVLADYRSFDTLGETTVIFTAGVVTVLLLRTGSKGHRRLREENKE